jgi:hypothetical protein
VIEAPFAEWIRALVLVLIGLILGPAVKLAITAVRGSADGASR